MSTTSLALFPATVPVARLFISNCQASPLSPLYEYSKSHLVPARNRSCLPTSTNNSQPSVAKATPTSFMSTSTLVTMESTVTQVVLHWHKSASLESGQVAVTLLPSPPLDSPTESSPSPTKMSRRDQLHDSPSSEDWESKKGVIEKLYLKENLNLREVMEIMANAHDFRAT